MESILKGVFQKSDMTEAAKLTFISKLVLRIRTLAPQDVSMLIEFALEQFQMPTKSIEFKTGILILTSCSVGHRDLFLTRFANPWIRSVLEPCDSDKEPVKVASLVALIVERKQAIALKHTTLTLSQKAVQGDIDLDLEDIRASFQVHQQTPEAVRKLEFDDLYVTLFTKLPTCRPLSDDNYVEFLVNTLARISDDQQQQAPVVLSLQSMKSAILQLVQESWTKSVDNLHNTISQLFANLSEVERKDSMTALADLLQLIPKEFTAVVDPFIQSLEQDVLWRFKVPLQRLLDWLITLPQVIGIGPWIIAILETLSNRGQVQVLQELTNKNGMKIARLLGTRSKRDDAFPILRFMLLGSKDSKTLFLQVLPGLIPLLAATQPPRRPEDREFAISISNLTQTMMIVFGGKETLKQERWQELQSENKSRNNSYNNSHESEGVDGADSGDEPRLPPTKKQILQQRATGPELYDRVEKTIVFLKLPTVSKSEALETVKGKNWELLFRQQQQHGLRGLQLQPIHNNSYDSSSNSANRSYLRLPMHRSPKPLGKVGLEGPANFICFINSGLRILYVTTEFRESILDLMQRQQLQGLQPSSIWTSHLMATMKNLGNSKEPVYDAEKVRSTAKGGLNDGRQHDIQEFLNELFNHLLEEKCLKNSLSPQLDSGTVLKSFIGTYKVDFQCYESNCRKVWSTRKPFEVLEPVFPVYTLKDRDGISGISGPNLKIQDLVNDFLKLYSHHGSYSDRCGNCQGAGVVLKSVIVEPVPKNLLIHLSGSQAVLVDEVLRKYQTFKITTRVEITERLVIQSMNDDDEEKTASSPSWRSWYYEPYAIAVHAGASFDHGHYFVFAKERQDGERWVLYDDAHVTLSSWSEILRCLEKRANTPSVVAYRLMDMHQQEQQEPTVAT